MEILAKIEDVGAQINAEIQDVGLNVNVTVEGRNGYNIGDGLQIDRATNTISVDKAEVVAEGDGRPVTAGAVYNTVSPIEWTAENGEIYLTNSLIYPFNDSAQTVALTKNYFENQYQVFCEVLESTGNVGEVTVSEKLSNGFKIAYTGSAKSAKIGYRVVGGVRQ